MRWFGGAWFRSASAQEVDGLYIKGLPLLTSIPWGLHHPKRSAAGFMTPFMSWASTKFSLNLVWVSTSPT